jgi:hypothetical protein
MQIESSAVVDTNEEYIQPQNAVKEPPVLGTVFKAVVVETVKDFFSGIFGFFFRYIRHFFRSFLYFWSPSLRKQPFDKLDYKENCQHSFELALLVLFMIIFAVKLEWIPGTSSANMEVLNNDLSQMSLQFFWFLIFALAYFALAMIAIGTGRLLRAMLKIRITKRESDILFIYLNNAFFSITSVVALCVRASTSLEHTDADSLSQGLATIFFPTCFLLVALWSIRFAVVQKLSWWKGAVFFLLGAVVFTSLFTLGGMITSIFFVVI